MALTKVSRGLLTTSIVDNGNATAITIGSDESVALGGTLSLPNANGTNEISFTGTEFTNVLSATTSGFQLGTTGAGYLSFLTNNAERMRIDGATGNVGFGVSPHSGWYGNATALQISSTGAIYNTSNFEDFNLANNVYINSSGTDSYIQNDAACKIRLTDAGLMDFRVAGAGSAGAAISWTVAMSIDSTGNLLVGKSTTALGTAGLTFGAAGFASLTRSGAEALNINRLSSDGALAVFYKDGTAVGSISTNASSLPSDRNFKKNIENLSLGLNFISSLEPVTYNYKIDDDGAPVMAGLIAQDVETALTAEGVEANSMTLLQHKPTEDVKESDYQMDYLKLLPVLINAVKELTERLEQLENN